MPAEIAGSKKPVGQPYEERGCSGAISASAEGDGETRAEGTMGSKQTYNVLSMPWQCGSWYKSNMSKESVFLTLIIKTERDVICLQICVCCCILRASTAAHLAAGWHCHTACNRHPTGRNRAMLMLTISTDLLMNKNTSISICISRTCCIVTSLAAKPSASNRRGRMLRRHCGERRHFKSL